MNATVQIARGLRLNNPLNIRRSGFVWDGEKRPPADPDFAEFETPIYGIRAATKLLWNYHFKQRHLSTIREIVETWAPRADGNDTSAYIERVSEWSGFGADDGLAFDRPTLIKLVAAMARQETGFDDQDAVEHGVDLFLRG